MARARSSFPVPLSPVMSTVDGVEATLGIMSRIRWIGALDPMNSGTSKGLSSDLGSREELGEDGLEIVDVEGLREILGGAGPQSFEGVLRGGVGGDDDERGVELLVASVLERPPVRCRPGA